MKRYQTVYRATVGRDSWERAYSETLEEYPERKERFAGYANIEYDPL